MNIAIYGYGNLGRGVETAALQNSDCNLVGIFTRRDPQKITTLTDVPVYSSEQIYSFKDVVDVLIICGGSATDLPQLTPELARDFNVVDSFDTHAKIPEHFDAVDYAAKSSGHIAMISAGWDPGMFSINRLYASALLPDGTDYTFWGKGISQGHSDAIRRIDGVLDARQYTVPCESAIDAVRKGNQPVLSVRDKHTRECFVVAKEGSDLNAIKNEIENMPNYFADYDTSVTFISEEQLKTEHSGMPHGGSVLRIGTTGVDGSNKHIIEYSLKLDSNPEFTGSALIAFARAINKMHKRGQTGCTTVFDIAPADLSPLTKEQLRKVML